VQVAVIGDAPKLVEPTTGPFGGGDAVLLANVAQGLVRFDARGQIVPGLAERWNVSDDGLSYIFRLASGEWHDERKVSAHQVARLLRRTIGARSKNPLKDTLGAVAEIVAMTDRVLEIRLKAPRPNLLQLLAQPEMALVREQQGTGPFEIDDDRGPGGEMRLKRRLPSPDGEEEQREDLWLTGHNAPAAVQRFATGQLDLVLGGSFADLPYARGAQLPRGALRFDPVAGLFGLVPARRGTPLDEPEVRQLLAQAIDRDAFVAAINVPGLIGRATVLESGLEGLPNPALPPWTATPIGERRPALIAAADRLFRADERPVFRIAMPESPGARLLLQRLAQDWALLGVRVELSKPGQRADLKLIDAVAPSTSPAWFLRQLRCGVAPICSEQIDELLEGARTAPVAAQRAALLAEAARRMDEQQLFLPITAPVRWSLVGDRVQGFAPNRFGRHTLTGLQQRLARQGAD
jgi:peptide/nickel transport system substrate-binding protein